MLFLRDMTLLQVNLYVLMSMCHLIYLMHIQMYKSKNIYRAEVINEVCVLSSSYLHYQFFITEPEEGDPTQIRQLKDINGYILINVIIFDLVFNIGFLMTDSVKDGWKTIKYGFA